MEANAVEGGTIGVEEKGTTWALVVATLALSKGAAMADEGAIIEPAKVAGAFSSVVTRAASYTSITSGGEGVEVTGVETTTL